MKNNERAHLYRLLLGPLNLRYLAKPRNLNLMSNRQTLKGIKFLILMYFTPKINVIRLKFETRLKYSWFHLILYSMFKPALNWKRFLADSLNSDLGLAISELSVISLKYYWSSGNEVIMVGGGDSNYQLLSLVEIYDLSEGFIKELPSMPTPRYCFTVIFVIYIFLFKLHILFSYFLVF